MTKKTAKKAAKKRPAKKLNDEFAPAKATATALPNREDIPEGFKQMGGGYAPSWRPEDKNVLHGTVTAGVREVEMTIGRKKQTRRVIEITELETKDRYAVWESAAMGDFFDAVAEEGEGGVYFIRFDGLGKAKKGQNAPKLFTIAAAE